MVPDSGTGWIGRGLTAWVRLVLKFRKLTIVMGMAAGVGCLIYAGQNLGINQVARIQKIRVRGAPTRRKSRKRY